MKNRRINSKFLLIPVLVLAAVFILSCEVKVDVDMKESNAEEPTLWTEKGKVQSPLTSSTIKSIESELSKLATRLNPSVVNISTETTLKLPTPQRRRMPGQQQPPEFFWKFFEDFFGPDFMPRDQKRQSLGSGFVIHEEGYIITNYHVVQKADEIFVTFTEKEDAQKYKAEIIGSDEKTDIALIKIDPDRKLPVAPLGNSDEVEVGNLVLAIGNPFGHGHSVTMGIISAKGRILPTAMFSPYTDYFQTDASINPGNSGGPIINSKGEVIGIANAIDARAQGIGFAIPINVAKDLIPQLKEKGKVSRGWLGVSIDKITPELRDHLKLPKKLKGVIVTEVFKGDPAANAGIKAYDVIYKFNDKPITSRRDLIGAVGTAGVATSGIVKVYRDGKKKTFTVKLAERKDEELAKLRSKDKNGKEKEENKEEMVNLGISASNITTQMKELFQLEKKSGVVITDVDRGSVAANAGIRPGDIVLEVDRKKINNTKDLELATKGLKPGKSALFYIQRGTMKTFISVKIPKEKK